MTPAKLSIVGWPERRSTTAARRRTRNARNRRLDPNPNRMSVSVIAVFHDLNLRRPTQAGEMDASL